MTAGRKAALVAGILFILADITGIPATVLSMPLTNAPDYLSRISGSTGTMALSALLELVMGCACAGIAVALYPVLKKQHPALALGAVSFRIIEGIFEAASAIGLVLLVTISIQFSKAAAQGAACLQTLGDVLSDARGWMGSVGRQTGWSLGALLYYAAMFRSRLLPRWLTGWAFAGNILTLAAVPLYMFRVLTPWSTADMFFTLPAGLAELILAVWLIVKGFNNGTDQR
jgi:hypothetical protein